MASFQYLRFLFDSLFSMAVIKVDHAKWLTDQTKKTLPVSGCFQSRITKVGIVCKPIASNRSIRNRLLVRVRSQVRVDELG